MPSSSFGCLLFDAAIAVWFLAGAPSLLARWQRSPTRAGSSPARAHSLIPFGGTRRLRWACCGASADALIESLPSKTARGASRRIGRVVTPNGARSGRARRRVKPVLPGPPVASGRRSKVAVAVDFSSSVVARPLVSEEAGANDTGLTARNGGTGLAVRAAHAPPAGPRSSGIRGLSRDSHQRHAPGRPVRACARPTPSRRDGVPGAAWARGHGRPHLSAGRQHARWAARPAAPVCPGQRLRGWVERALLLQSCAVRHLRDDVLV
jgi:hypothetical protein